MKLTTMIVFLLAAKILTASETYVKTYTGLNKFCDPLETYYPGGTPLFNEKTGKSIELKNYLRQKGLNIYCDSFNTHYPGGSPLFDEHSGQKISMKEYLRKKVLIIIKGLNEYCDPYETMYIINPNKKDYLAEKGFNEFCDPVDTYYPGGTPLFDESNNKFIPLKEYLENKTIKIYQ